MCEIGVGFYCCICVQYELWFFYYNAQVLYEKLVCFFYYCTCSTRVGFFYTYVHFYFLALIAVTFTVTKSLNRYVIGF